MRQSRFTEAQMSSLSCANTMPEPRLPNLLGATAFMPTRSGFGNRNMPVWTLASSGPQQWAEIRSRLRALIRAFDPGAMPWVDEHAYCRWFISGSSSPLSRSHPLR